LESNPVIERSDKALARRILKGEPEACAELIREFHAPIYRLLVHLSRDAEVAQDLTQETFLAAWKKIGSFSAASSLRTWLHTIAYRKFLDAKRSSRRTVAVHSEAPVDELHALTPDPTTTAQLNEQTRRVHGALNRLAANEREILVLHYLQGLSYQELADILSEPTGTVKWRTRQALERLRTVLENKP
jgi:RNA polymerase sigma-70 factor, ECF subfamily